MPSALAVLRLMTSSYFVGACTGRSAGFSPLRMRSTLAGCGAERTNGFSPIGDETTSADVISEGINRWQLVAGGQPGNDTRIVCPKRTRCHNQTAVRATRKFTDVALDRPDILQIDYIQLHPDWSHRLDCGKLANSGGKGGIAQNRRARHVWRDLLEYLQPLRTDRVLEGRKSSDVAARPR